MPFAQRALVVALLLQACATAAPPLPTFTVSAARPSEPAPTVRLLGPVSESTLFYREGFPIAESSKSGSRSKRGDSESLHRIALHPSDREKASQRQGAQPIRVSFVFDSGDDVIRQALQHDHVLADLLASPSKA